MLFPPEIALFFTVLAFALALTLLLLLLFVGLTGIPSLPFGMTREDFLADAGNRFLAGVFMAGVVVLLFTVPKDLGIVVCWALLLLLLLKLLGVIDAIDGMLVTLLTLMLLIFMLMFDMKDWGCCSFDAVCCCCSCGCRCGCCCCCGCCKSSFFVSGFVSSFCWRASMLNIPPILNEGATGDVWCKKRNEYR